MIKNKLKLLPHLSGVYIFKDISKNPIYIGKAKSLKKRVPSYFLENNKDWKSDFLCDEICDLDYIITKNETEALLLEAQLIRKYQPKFNTLLKDGQPFIYITLTKQDIPQLKLVRNKKEKGTYFGPFLYKGQARSIYNFLLNSFQLRLCNKKIDNGCLQYHLGKCAGSCKKDFNLDSYLFRLHLTLDILNGKKTDIYKKINIEIKKSNDIFNFEHSKKLHVILENLSYIFEVIKTKFNPAKFNGDEKVAFEKLPLNHESIGMKIAQLLHIKKPPHTIDCFDISHIQSRYIVGSAVRFSYGTPDKNNFRRFKIKTLTTQNDYEALKEITKRRYKNIKDLPDLILIDGGKGQRNVIKELFPETNVISLAKKEEKLFSSAYKDGKKINAQTDEGRTLIALRDYAHHFAITYHRTKRGAFLTQS
jgi:excinuclease ABC subunit C